MRRLLDFLSKKRGRLRIDKENAKFSDPDRDVERIFIGYDMMMKGNSYNRPSGRVRQIAVTVNGSTRLVTTGEHVDLATYQALVAFGAIEPIPDIERLQKVSSPQPLVEDQAV